MITDPLQDHHHSTDRPLRTDQAWLIGALVTTAVTATAHVTAQAARHDMPTELHHILIGATVLAWCVAAIWRVEHRISDRLAAIEEQRDGEEYQRGYLDGVQRRPPGGSAGQVVPIRTG